ncbi:MAG TPA: hypothetical protein VF212_15045 [Longimicrobiales bacterium]
MSRVVLKFGGTSLGTARRVRRAAARVRRHVERGERPVVVVSAAGHTTDRLLARVGRLGAADAAPDAGRELDRALATGEDRSAAVLALALWLEGVPARSLRGGEAGIVAEGAFGAGTIRHVLPHPLLELLDRGIVPVVSGFQGERLDGETVTLGRGGSDTSAVAIAAALDAAPCHIVTDVDAVYDRDPAIHADARPFAALDHDALVALAESGAEVLCADAARLARRHAVPLAIYHYRAPIAAPRGTRVGWPAATPPATATTSAGAGGRRSA